MGYYLAMKAYEANHAVTILNRGLSPDNLPEDVGRLRCDRTDFHQMRRALTGRDFDVVVDMTLFRQREAESIINILDGQVGHYIFVSTGQVYLVRDGIQRPFREADYHGPVISAPELNTYDYEEWLYGMDKRRAEDAFYEAAAQRNFPFTALRLPMVNSERDTFNRLYGYVLRIQDGGPILVPDAPEYPLRHVYGGDVVQAMMRLIETGSTEHRAFNISQDEAVSLEGFLTIIADIVEQPLHLTRFQRPKLEAQGFLPDCSPFSESWMSELDNTLSKEVLGMQYTPLRDYLRCIINYYDSTYPARPSSYRRRHAEKLFAASA